MDETGLVKQHSLLLSVMLNSLQTHKASTVKPH